MSMSKVIIQKVEEQGIDPCASWMQTKRSTIWATPPVYSEHYEQVRLAFRAGYGTKIQNDIAEIWTLAGKAQ